MSDQRSFFHDMREIEPKSWPINGIGGTVLYAHGIGTVKMTRTVNGKRSDGDLKDVLFVPGLGVTLISIASITSNGYNVIFSGSTANVTINNSLVMSGTRTGDSLYRVDAVPQRTTSTMSLAATSNEASITTWHQRLGHVNAQTVTRMASGVGVKGMIISPLNSTMEECCDGCHVGKMHKIPFPTSKTTTREVEELIVSDVVGPLQVPSVSGKRYYVVFKDVSSKYKVVYFL